MFDPVLEHNRKEFERLGRLKFKVFLLSLLCLPLLAVALVAIVRSNLPQKAGEYLIIACLAGLFAVFGVLEVKRTIIFRRDLREQRTTDGGTRNQM